MAGIRPKRRRGQGRPWGAVLRLPAPAIPTVSFISFWAGLAMAVRLVGLLSLLEETARFSAAKRASRQVNALRRDH
jgi:hypothetical protein